MAAGVFGMQRMIGVPAPVTGRHVPDHLRLHGDHDEARPRIEEGRDVGAGRDTFFRRAPPQRLVGLHYGDLAWREPA
jgi:hypothetical protein